MQSRQKPTVAAALALAALASPAGAAGQEPAAERPRVEHLDSGKVLPPGLPFSEAVRVGDLVLLSGQIGIVPGKLELVAGGIEAETRQTLENIRATLAAHGLALADVVRCTVMLADIADWPKFNEIYTSYFSPPYPARSALGANGLAFGARVEIECTAAARERAAP
jgi:reactive intermediate/imine deaminase